MEIYRFVQENPGVTIEEIASAFDSPVKTIQTMVFSGALGTANQLISNYCARCKCEMSYVNRVGHFCYACNKFVEKEAGVGITENERRLENIKKGLSAFHRGDDEKETPKNSPQLSTGKTKPGNESVRRSSSPSQQARFGFKRISS